ncbi:MAG: DUF2149 domain-containing protein [Syntrophomonadaceae bacterium]|nr:DUF2149 domain-containing protein [Syntrophomonadaceae bacterium]
MDGGLRRNSRWRQEDINPLEGAINIVDAMLVFACGLMLALALNWNVDLGLQQLKVEVEQGQEITHVPEIREDLIETQGQGQLYERMGTVYKDPATGKLFMLTD